MTSNTNIPESAKQEMILGLNRKLLEIFDGVLKSKDISKDFYLIRVEIQNNVEGFQEEISMLSATMTVEDLIENGFFSANNKYNQKQVYEVLLKNLKEAYEIINEEVNGK